MAISEAKRIKLEAERRGQILSVALGMFYRKGYANTTVADIAEAAGMSKGLVYRYFDSKADILFAYREYLDGCFDELRQLTPRAAIREAAVRFLVEPDENGNFHPLRVYLVVLIKGELQDERFEDMHITDIGTSFYADMFRKGIEQGEFRAGNPDELGDIFWHFLLGYVIDSIMAPEKIKPDEAIARMDRILNMFAE